MYKFSLIEGTHFQNLPTELLTYIYSLVPKVKASWEVQGIIQQKYQAIKEFNDYMIEEEAFAYSRDREYLNQGPLNNIGVPAVFPPHYYAYRTLASIKRNSPDTYPTAKKRAKTAFAKVKEQIEDLYLDVAGLIILYDYSYPHLPPRSHHAFNPSDHAFRQIAHMRKFIADHVRYARSTEEMLSLWEKIVNGDTIPIDILSRTKTLKKLK